MPEEIKRIPSINVVIQEFSIVEVRYSSRIYDMDIKTLTNTVLKHFI